MSHTLKNPDYSIVSKHFSGVPTWSLALDGDGHGHKKKFPNELRIKEDVRIRLKELFSEFRIKKSKTNRSTFYWILKFIDEEQLISQFDSNIKPDKKSVKEVRKIKLFLEKSPISRLKLESLKKDHIYINGEAQTFLIQQLKDWVDKNGGPKILQEKRGRPESTLNAYRKEWIISIVNFLKEQGHSDEDAILVAFELIKLKGHKFKIKNGEELYRKNSEKDKYIIKVIKRVYLAQNKNTSN